MDDKIKLILFLLFVILPILQSIFRWFKERKEKRQALERIVSRNKERRLNADPSAKANEDDYAWEEVHEDDPEEWDFEVDEWDREDQPQEAIQADASRRPPLPQIDQSYPGMGFDEMRSILAQHAKGSDQKKLLQQRLAEQQTRQQKLEQQKLAQQRLAQAARQQQEDQSSSSAAAISQHSSHHSSSTTAEKATANLADDDLAAHFTWDDSNPHPTESGRHKSHSKIGIEMRKSKADLRRALVWAEILSPPLCLQNSQATPGERKLGRR